MASVNTLIRKGYLLAGVIMAANMFVVNEVKATDEENNDINIDINDNKKKEGENKTLSLEGVLNFALSWENTINLAKGLFSLVLITIFDGGIIMQEDIGSLDVLDGDPGGF